MKENRLDKYVFYVLSIVSSK